MEVCVGTLDVESCLRDHLTCSDSFSRFALEVFMSRVVWEMSCQLVMIEDG